MNIYSRFISLPSTPLIWQSFLSSFTITWCNFFKADWLVRLYFKVPNQLYHTFSKTDSGLCLYWSFCVQIAIACTILSESAFLTKHVFIHYVLPIIIVFSKKISALLSHLGDEKYTFLIFSFTSFSFIEFLFFLFVVEFLLLLLVFLSMALTYSHFGLQ